MTPGGGRGIEKVKRRWRLYDTRMALPFDPKRFRAYEVEFSAGGQRFGCKFLLDDDSLLFVHESQITPEIESLMASLGSPTKGLRHGDPVDTNES
jgi:hypothetical protein